jgi:hypothetical protein
MCGLGTLNVISLEGLQRFEAAHLEWGIGNATGASHSAGFVYAVVFVELSADVCPIGRSWQVGVRSDS